MNESDTSHSIHSQIWICIGDDHRIFSYIPRFCCSMNLALAQFLPRAVHHRTSHFPLSVSCTTGLWNIMKEVREYLISSICFEQSVMINSWTTNSIDIHLLGMLMVALMISYPIWLWPNWYYQHHKANRHRKSVCIDE